MSTINNVVFASTTRGVGSFVKKYTGENRTKFETPAGFKCETFPMVESVKAYPIVIQTPSGDYFTGLMAHKKGMGDFAKGGVDPIQHVVFEYRNGQRLTPYCVEDFFGMILVGGKNRHLITEDKETKTSCIFSSSIHPDVVDKKLEDWVRINLHGNQVSGSVVLEMAWGDVEGFDAWTLCLEICDHDRAKELSAVLVNSDAETILRKFNMHKPQLIEVCETQRAAAFGKANAKEPAVGRQEMSRTAGESEERPSVDVPLAEMVPIRLPKVFTEYKKGDSFEDNDVKPVSVKEHPITIGSDYGLGAVQSVFYETFARIRIQVLFVGREGSYWVYYQTQPLDKEFVEAAEEHLNNDEYVMDMISGTELHAVVCRDIYDTEQETRRARDKRIQERNGRLTFPGFPTDSVERPLEPMNVSPNPYRPRGFNQVGYQRSEVNDLINQVISRDVMVKDLDSLELSITRDRDGFIVKGAFSTRVSVPEGRRPRRDRYRDDNRGRSRDRWDEREEEMEEDRRRHRR